jgi:hypothetical protein
MTSRITEVVEAAAMEIAVTGSLSHLYTTCSKDGFVNAKPTPAEPDACTACQLNEIATELRQSRAVQQLPRRAAPQQRIGPCPCACNSGGFCGGCGHAGCGGRR